MTTNAPTSLGEPQLRKPFRPRRPTSASNPSTGPGSMTTVWKMEGSQSPYSRRQYKTCGQQISYCGVGYHHQNAIVGCRIKEFILGSWTLLLHATRLWSELVSNMLWNFFFKAACQRYNSLEMDEDGKTPEHKISGVELQISPTDYHTWV